jgi:hypothetical protein
MPLDLSRIGAGRTERLIVPREIYSALPSRPWPYLRLEQGEVLERWYARRDQRDIVIKQNTGGGKTAAGLLIAQSSLNEGCGPAAYVVPDTYLVAQVQAEAAKLGISVTSDARTAEFASGRAVLVTTFQKIVNGRSVFGVAGDGREVLEIGTVIVDDAHAALAITEDQFRLTISKDPKDPSERHQAYAMLLDLFEEELIAQSRSDWQDIQTGVRQAVQRIPFWAWADRQDRVMDILHPLRDGELMFTWPLVKDVLPICAATVTSAAVEIRPPCPPIARIPSFARARRRIYLTATLADDSVLVTDLDADADSVRSPVTPELASDLGDRIILAPLEINPNLDERAIRQLAREVADGNLLGESGATPEKHNVVVLVPGDRQAEVWKPFADAIWHVGDLTDGVARLKRDHIGLVVLVNKYDGVDLPGDACRLLIIDGLPRVFDAAERRERAAGMPTPSLLARSIQRVEQGMGRGVRDLNDYCAVLLLGADLTQAINQPRQRELFSPATRAQLDLSAEVARQITGEGIEALRKALSLCIGHDPEWVTHSRRALADVQYDKAGTVRPSAVAARAAFDEAARGQYARAADIIGTAANAIAVSEAAERGWLKEQQAVYLDFVDRAEAQRVLATANESNPGVLRPSAGVPVKLVRATQVQARRAAEFLAGEYDGGAQLVLGVKAMLANIEWDPDHTGEAEAAFEQLGFHLGFGGQRPDHLYGIGPDNLWALSGDRHAVIELKTGVKTTAMIAKKDLGQLDQSLRWYRDNYTDTKDPVPVIVQAREVCERTGTPVSDMRVLTEEKLTQLKGAVTAMAVALARDDGRWGDESAVAEQLAAGHLSGGELFTYYTKPATVAKR